MLSTYLGFWKRSQWLNYDACNFFSVQCALLNMFLVDLLRSAMLSLNMSTCSIWVAGRAKKHKRIRSVASERVCKLSALYHEASNSAISYVTGPFKGIWINIVIRELRHCYRNVFFSCWPCAGPLPWLGVFKYINQCHCPGWEYLNI